MLKYQYFKNDRVIYMNFELIFLTVTAIRLLKLIYYYVDFNELF